MARTLRRWGLATAAATVVAASLGACGGGGDNTSAAASGSAQQAPRIVYTSALDPDELGGYVAPLDYNKFGLPKTDTGDIKILDSHATATQVLLSGKADIIGGSFVSDLQVIEKGVPMKVFCPYTSGVVAAIVGVDNVTSLDYLASHKDTPVALASPGDPSNFFVDLVLRAKHIPVTTLDFTNIKLIEDAPQRLSALANGDAKMALITMDELHTLQKQLGNRVHVLSDVMKDLGSGSIFLAYAATDKWLQSHQKEAAEFCASVLTANGALTQDFGTFKAMADKYIKPSIDEPTLRANWQDIKKYDLFPAQNTLTKDTVGLVAGAAAQTHILQGPLPYDKIVDSAVIDKAVSLAGPQ